MDNISHAVVSMVAGELLHRTLPAESTDKAQSLRQKLLIFTAAAAGNFPDLDLVLYPLMKKPLGYLLHHRGHSHTLVGACFESLLLFAITLALWPAARRLWRSSTLTKRAYVLASAVGFALHISMDWLNSYGVHPFYPLYNGWLYGDLVFIVEPIFWIAFGVPLAFLTHRKWLRYPWLVFICGVPLYAFSKNLLPLASIGVLAVIAILVGTLRNRRALVTAWAVALAFLIVQGFASARARTLVAAELKHLNPQTLVLDDALTASPTNPFCWSFVTIEKSASDYKLRNGRVSIASSWIRPESCTQILGSQTSLTALGEDILQTSEVTADLALLRKAVTDNCDLADWMRFARMPLVTEESASDLRFSRGAGPNFTKMDYNANECPAWAPPWTPPREDLLK